MNIVMRVTVFSFDARRRVHRALCSAALCNITAELPLVKDNKPVEA
jgi:hypothetical protein